MKFVFWQNVVSIHQSAFIKALSRNHDVTLIAQEEISPQRKSEGWNVPDMGDAHVIISPNEHLIDKILSEENAHHVFSGIDAYPLVYHAFKKAVIGSSNISVMMEPYDWTGLRGKLRGIKYIILRTRYAKYIKHIFTTGNMGIKCYRKVGFPASKLHQWGYFTEPIRIKTSEHNVLPKVIYVGRIDKNKNVLHLAETLNKITDLYESALFIGNGALEEQLMNIINTNPKCHYLGSLPNREVAKKISECDLLVLPSIYDGWGAVVNEALQQGTRVLCSNRCGASILLDGRTRGEEFNKKNMINVINKWLKTGPISEEQRDVIKQWSKTHISGDVAADYFVGIIKGETIKAPWID